MLPFACGVHGLYLTAVNAQIPENISFEQASTLPVGLDTAALGLFTPDIPPEQEFASAGLVGPWEEDGCGKYAGNPIVVFGAASSVGQYGSFMLLYKPPHVS